MRQCDRRQSRDRPLALTGVAAGLLLLFPIEDRPHLLLTVRSDRVRHGGQVSMPGGVIEAGDDALP